MNVYNALTIDLEDWFQVSNLDDHLSRDQWQKCEFRLEQSSDRLLYLLNEYKAKATFFVLGWNAERCPSLIRKIASEGHELATHGYSHHLIYTMTQEAFRDDLKRSIEVVENAAGVRVIGHRAASFSITERSLWALEVLAAEGIMYDSSMFPIRHDRYGVPSCWAEQSEIQTQFGSIIEAPITTWQIIRKNVPFAGGGYFRLLPYAVVKQITSAFNKKDKSVVFYFHPWEIDPGIPRFNLGKIKSYRSYCNIESNESKFVALLRDFKFIPLSEALKLNREIMPVRILRSGRRDERVLV